VQAGDAKRAVRHPEGRFSVAEVEKKPSSASLATFITSTLQQEAARKLGFAAARTMKIGTGLYEGVEVGGETVGLITYMRPTVFRWRRSDRRKPPRHRRAARRSLCARSAPRLFFDASRMRRKRTRQSADQFPRTPEKVSRYLDRDRRALTS
jgi:DNA topoisomerase-1